MQGRKVLFFKRLLKILCTQYKSADNINIKINININLKSFAYLTRTVLVK